ncbi:MAG: hypothetical protein WBC75_01340 [Dehalococcoidales bacterium]
MVEDSKSDIETRQARREEKRRKKRAQVKKHGKNLARVYMDAILKRLRRR